jgi:membrane-associated protease RseP (regulator of RpoE activity)
LKDGDQIVDIDGTATRTFDEVSRSVASKRGGARSMRVTVSRPNAHQGTERMTVDIAPNESGLIGVRPSGDLASASWATALGAGLRAPWTSLIRTAQMCREILSGGQQAMPLTTVSALRARNEPSFVGPLLTSFGIECAVVWPVFVLLAVVLGLRSNWRIA